MDVAVEVYKVSLLLPIDEKFNLIHQIKKCAVSIPSNIAEGSARFSGQDQARFYEIAYGSLMELLNQLIISVDLEYLTVVSLDKFRSGINELSYSLTSLRSEALKSKN